MRGLKVVILTLILTLGTGVISYGDVDTRIRNTRDTIFTGENGNFGIKDHEGNVIADAVYSFVDNKMTGDRLLISVNNKFGFLSKEYKPLIEPIYDELWDANSGLAYARKSGKRFYINKKGDIVSPIVNDNGFLHLQKVNGEHAIYALNNAYNDPIKLGAYNILTGEEVLPFEYDDLFFIPDNKYLYGKQDKSGQIITYFEIDSSGNEKLVPITDTVLSVDDEGFITIYAYETITYDADGNLTGKREIARMGLLDNNYNVLVDKIIEHSVPTPILFTDDISIVATGAKEFRGNQQIVGNWKYGAMNRAGQFIISPQYNSLEYLGYGLFLASESGQSFVMDINENQVPIQFDYSSTPSAWAVSEVTEAYNLGLLTEKQYQYQWNITRQEFCELIINCYECVFGSEALPQIMNLDVFSDTSNPNVLMAYELGIVAGSDGRFYPFRNISRQEMTIILTKLAVKLNLDVNVKSQVPFSDDNSIAPWAKESVYQVAGLKDSNNRNVVSSTGDNKFSPLDMLTIEQAILILNRLYNIVDSSENIST